MFFTASDFTSITSHIQNCLSLSLQLHLFILSGVIFHWSPVAYWPPTDLGSSSFSILSYCLFILFMGFLRQELNHWHSLPFPSPVDHFLSELSTMTHQSWVVLHGVAHSFIELDNAVVHVCSHFWAQEKKVCQCFHCFPIYLPWSDGSRCHDLHFLNVEF